MSGDKCRWFNKNGFAFGTGECVLHRRVCGSGHNVCEQYEEYGPRPHGEWMNKDYGIGKCWATCSECGESTNGEAQDNGFGYDYSFPKFCPNCGADMRKRGEE